MNRNVRAAVVVTVCVITAVVVAHGNAVSDDPPAPLSTPTPAPTAHAMAHCVNEDGSGGSGLPCRWDGHKDGNGMGLSYVIHTSGRVEYERGQQDPEGTHAPFWMWSADPETTAGRTISPAYETGAEHHVVWQRVDHELGDALAEGGAPHADTRNWSECFHSATVVVCPDGWTEGL